MGDSLADRGPPESYYPGYVDADEVEFNYAYAKCRCGWESERLNHPSMTEYHINQHLRWGHTVDCDAGTHVIVFEDGTVAEI